MHESIFEVKNKGMFLCLKQIVFSHVYMCELKILLKFSKKNKRIDMFMLMTCYMDNFSDKLIFLTQITFHTEKAIFLNA